MAKKEPKGAITLFVELLLNTAVGFDKLIYKNLPRFILGSEGETREDIIFLVFQGLYNSDLSESLTIVHLPDEWLKAFALADEWDSEMFNEAMEDVGEEGIPGLLIGLAALAKKLNMEFVQEKEPRAKRKPRTKAKRKARAKGKRKAKTTRKPSSKGKRKAKAKSRPKTKSMAKRKAKGDKREINLGPAQAKFARAFQAAFPGKKNETEAEALARSLKGRTGAEWRQLMIDCGIKPNKINSAYHWQWSNSARLKPLM